MATTSKKLTKADGYVLIANDDELFKYQATGVTHITYTATNAKPDNDAPRFTIGQMAIEIRAGVSGFVWARNPNDYDLVATIATGEMV